MVGSQADTALWSSLCIFKGVSGERFSSLSVANLGRIYLSSVQHLQGNVHLCRIWKGHDMGREQAKVY